MKITENTIILCPKCHKGLAYNEYEKFSGISNYRSYGCNSCKLVIEITYNQNKFITWVLISTYNDISLSHKFIRYFVNSNNAYANYIETPIKLEPLNFGSEPLQTIVRDLYLIFENYHVL